MGGVLLVEDDAFTRMLLARAIESLGHSCDAVATARELRAAWEAASYDVVLLDLDLGPGPSGIDLARALRQSGATSGIVILTSYADPRLLGNLPAIPPDVAYVTKQSLDSPARLAEVLENTRAELAAESAASDTLTDSQMELLRLLAAGCSNSELGRRLWLSQPGVEKALARLATRLGITATSAENRRVLLVKEYYRMASGTDGPRA